MRMLNENGIIFADNILYKGYVMSDYNKHKQRTAVRNLREYIKETTENPMLDTEILEVGDGLAISKLKNKLKKTSQKKNLFFLSFTIYILYKIKMYQQ